MGHRILWLLPLLLLLGGGLSAAATEPPLVLRPPPPEAKKTPPSEAKKTPPSETKKTPPSEAKRTPPPKSQPKPVAANEITITAKQGIEWHRAEGFYLAKNSAVIQRGGSIISADLLKIYYDQIQHSSSAASVTTVFTRVEASGNSLIIEGGNRLVGDKAVIYLDSLESIVTGKNLSLTTANGEVVTARDSLEYRDVTHLAVARGAAKLVNGTQTMTADILTASLKPNRGGALQFSQTNGFGNVRVTDGDQTMNADILSAIMKPTSNGAMQFSQANGFGNVRITKGDQTMTADILSAIMKPTSNGAMQFSQANGFGNVRITSPNRAASGDRGSFDPIKNFALLSGNVKLGQGNSLITGDYGEMNMTTGAGRILLGPEAAAAGRQLRAVIIPSDLPNKPATEAITPAK